MVATDKRSGGFWNNACQETPKGVIQIAAQHLLYRHQNRAIWRRACGDGAGIEGTYRSGWGGCGIRARVKSAMQTDGRTCKWEKPRVEIDDQSNRFSRPINQERPHVNCASSYSSYSYTYTRLWCAGGFKVHLSLEFKKSDGSSGGGAESR